MTKIDDILFAPIQPWREHCREVAAYIAINGEQLKPMRQIYPLDRPRPAGALLLEQLMELYHVNGRRDFCFVLGFREGPQQHYMTFDGTILFGKYENGKFPLLGGFQGRRSIRDLNLVPNTYTRHYVFVTAHEANTYMMSLS